MWALLDRLHSQKQVRLTKKRKKGKKNLNTQPTDVILLVGTRLNWMFNYGNAPTFSSTAKFIQLDVAAEDLNSNVHAEIALCGDLQLALRHWNNTPRYRWQLKQKQWVEELQAKVAANRAALAKQCGDESVPMSYHFVLRTIAQALPKDCVVVNEGANTMDLCVSPKQTASHFGVAFFFLADD